MFKFLKTMFTKQNFEENVSVHDIQKAMDVLTKNMVSKGVEIANECMEDGLRKGNYIKLTEMESYIESLENYVEEKKYGFYKRMSEFLDSGEIIGFSFQGGETVYVHKDYISNFNELLKNTRND